MTTDRELVDALKQLQWRVPPDVDREVLGRIHAAFDQAMALPAVAPSAEFASRWRATSAAVLGAARRSWRSLAVASAATIIIAVAIFSLGTPTSLTLAEVEAAMAEQTWLHVKYDSGREIWQCLKDSRHFLVQENGRRVFLDPANGVRRVYQPELHYYPAHISEDRLTPWTPASTPWECAVGYLEKQLQRDDGQRSSVEKHEEIGGGRRLVRFDVYHTDALGRRLLLRQVWADPSTRLPVRTRERLQLAHRQEQGRDWITGVYDFPATGPASLYDLGVPRDVKVVRQASTTAPADPEVITLLKDGRAARQRFPARYRALVWREEKRTDNIELTWFGRPRTARRFYFNTPSLDLPGQELSVPASADQVLAWLKTQPPVESFIFDGEKAYRKRGPHPHLAETGVTIRILRDDYTDTTFWPESRQWGYAGRRGDVSKWAEHLHLMTPGPKVPSGIVVLGSSTDLRRTTYHIDTAHDHICVSLIQWLNASSGWTKEREYQMSDLTRLPEGQWYAKRILLICYGVPPGTDRDERPFNVDIKVLKEDEFPPDIFDGQKLLEQSKAQGAKVETY